MSCSPYIDTKHGIVSAGFLSSTQAFSGKMKAADGSSAVWSVTGTDGTSVANNAVGAWGTAESLKYAFKGLQSNNHLSAVQAKQPTIQNGQNLKAATTGKQIDANTAQFNKAVDNGAVPTVGTVTPVAPP